MDQTIETVIVGGGQAGLSTSYFLSQRGREYVVLEQAPAAGNAWRNGRWDSFTLVTPNFTILIPGAEYHGNDPGGYLPRDEIVAYFERYVERFALPVQYNTCVSSVEPNNAGYIVKTGHDTFHAANVVIASGFFQRPKLPSYSSHLPAHITQVHSGKYRSSRALPPGAVLVVGSAQSGCQIAEELYKSGRRVYLCTCSTGRAPRRYRGKDIFEWLGMIGFLDRTPDQLPSPQARFAGNPQLTGAHGGHSLSLHQFSRDGVRLLGHLRDVQDGRLVLAPDLRDCLATADKFEADIVKRIDGYIQKNGLDAPEDELPHLQDGYSVEPVTELDLASAGISAVVWAIGYTFDYSLVKLPVTTEDGYPIQQRGVTRYAGLYFIGLPWLYKLKSGFIFGVGEDAAYIAEHIISRAK
jgi:putative flavoprotein involved in K+ transport